MAYQNRPMTTRNTNGCQSCARQSANRMDMRRSSQPQMVNRVVNPRQVSGSMPVNTGHSKMNYEFDNAPLTMAYVPFQNWSETYDLETGFRRGTIFPDLDKMFMGGNCNEKR